ncbi:ABC transporter ATP-binding protein [Geomicrobium sp. JSM 1781026]|uniref:ABC transporter ATP-binding protein n=1 Tax=Geomicrobium sp. JSM 1781026 TaxID=3344580 RepID=UPI0035BEFE16
MDHIQFNQVVKKRGDFELNIPSITIQQGDMLGVIGNNGAGKTTMMQMVLGLLTLDSGELRRFHDGEEFHDVGKWKQDVGFVYDDLLMYDDMKLSRLGKFLSEQYHSWDDDHYRSMLEAYKVDETKKIKSLSRGMKMKAGFAMAMAHRPRLLMLDEPTAGLDQKSRRQMLRLLKEANEHGVTVIFSSHILGDMEELAGSVWLMDEGEVKAHGEVDDLKSRLGKDEEGNVIAKEDGSEDLVSLEDLHDFYLGGEDV